jgi:hypothetical protein
MPSTVGVTERACRNSARVPRIVAAALGCLVLAGCTSQSPPPPPPPPAPTVAPTSATYSAELCSAAAEYQTAANALVQLDAKQVGTDGVKAALQDLQTATSNLAAAAQR